MVVGKVVQPLRKDSFLGLSLAVRTSSRTLYCIAFPISFAMISSHLHPEHTIAKEKDDTLSAMRPFLRLSPSLSLDAIDWETEEVAMMPTTSVCNESLDFLVASHLHQNGSHTHSLVIKTSTKISIVSSEHSEKRQHHFSVNLFCNFEVISIRDNNSN